MYYKTTGAIKHHSDSQYIFWPDLASCHYAKATLECLEERNITFVPREVNPPAVPKCRPITDFCGALKTKVYSGGWEASMRCQLRQRIKKGAQEFNLWVVHGIMAKTETDLLKAADHARLSLILTENIIFI